MCGVVSEKKVRAALRGAHTSHSHKIVLSEENMFDSYDNNHMNLHECSFFHLISSGEAKNLLWECCDGDAYIIINAGRPSHRIRIAVKFHRYILKRQRTDEDSHSLVVPAASGGMLCIN
jgi:hypothetical protein